MPNVYRQHARTCSRRTVGETVPVCKNCECFVTPDFARVFGNNDGEVFRCADCTPFRKLATGASAVPNP